MKYKLFCLKVKRPLGKDNIKININIKIYFRGTHGELHWTTSWYRLLWWL